MASLTGLKALAKVIHWKWRAYGYFRANWEGYIMKEGTVKKNMGNNI